MELTTNEIQRLHALPKAKILAIMHECAEALGLVDIDEGSQALSIAKRTLYQKMKDKEVGEFVIGKHKFPLLNYK